MSRSGRNLFKRRFVRLKAWFTLGSVGITPRLVVAFASVAALAAAANLIVENGVAVLEKQRTVEKARSEVDSRAIHTLRESVSRARRMVTSAELARVLGLFERATQEHAEADTRSSSLRFANSRASLDQTLTKYQAENPPPSAQNLPPQITAHKKTADALVQATRLRRELLARYSGLLAGMEVGLKDAIDREWKVMGRVVARQPLLDVRAQLVDLRAAFAGAGILYADSASSASIAKAEWALSETLRRHADTLRKSESQAWLKSMNDNLTALISTRAALIRTEARRLTAADRFSRESKRLLESLPVNIEEPALPASAAPVQALSPVTSPPTHPPAEFEKPSGSLVGWMSGVVLVVLLYISFVTIISIVRPVRRMIAATNRLAKGSNARVVANGGIRELDSLAKAFNSMAEQLAVARDAAADSHQRLEAKVEERTRQLQELAEQDPLTGIANRRQLFVALNESLERATASGERVGLFFLDIDNFKTLNDSMGHTYGDRVLVSIARRLETIAAACGFAARLGGDEFTIIHQGSRDTQCIYDFGATIVRAFDAPLQVDEREVIVSVSVGVSVYPDHERDAEALLRAADAALFRAKALGRSQLAVFTSELLADASAKFAIEQKLRRAIQNDEFELFYQPLVNPHTGRVEQVEALIRWRKPDGSHRPPDEFLAVAEESGLIIEISDWVLRTAIRTAAEWHRGRWPDARVAINVSPRQFLDYRFVGRVEELLKQYGLPASCVELELVESALQTGAQTIRTLDQLRAVGVSIALDDFGTGYSSLASLQQLPLSRVKFDRSLVAAIDDSARSASIVRATIALCRSLDLDITAEGVERIEQLAMLLPQSPITVQGFLFARPVSGQELLPLLERMPRRCEELVEQLRGAARASEKRSKRFALVE
ncbi:MAG TPA: EAL domain-containing protein [Steroidobacteraceae bacterium]|nr:EAL domain-containing protein [Steroidobacteraceae bacterium]